MAEYHHVQVAVLVTSFPLIDLLCDKARNSTFAVQVSDTRPSPDKQKGETNKRNFFQGIAQPHHVESMYSDKRHKATPSMVPVEDDKGNLTYYPQQAVIRKTDLGGGNFKDGSYCPSPREEQLIFNYQNADLQQSDDTFPTQVCIGRTSEVCKNSPNSTADVKSKVLETLRGPLEISYVCFTGNIRNGEVFRGYDPLNDEQIDKYFTVGEYKNLLKEHDLMSAFFDQTNMEKDEETTFNGVLQELEKCAQDSKSYYLNRSETPT